MHQKVSNPIFDFNFIKILFPKFKFPQNAKLVTFSYFQKHEKFRVLQRLAMGGGGGGLGRIPALE